MKFHFVLLFALLLLSCSSNDEKSMPQDMGGTDDTVMDDDGTDDQSSQTCDEFDPSPIPVFDEEAKFFDWETSPYNLPYAVGETHLVGQGNNTGFGHSGFWRFGYDFIMDIGTGIYAARDGIVVHANDGTNDGNPNGTNLITILHEDETVALYSHLTRNGVLVAVGDTIVQGDLIGRSGNTGNTGNIPHLHFSLHPCSDLPGLPNPGNCPSLPVTFKNTEPNPMGLGSGQCYEAL